MYYEDRLHGRQFARVLLSGGSTVAGANQLRQELSDRLALDVLAVDPFGAPSDPGGLELSPALGDTLAPGLGILLRERAVA
jgi:hypothetical protein